VYFVGIHGRILQWQEGSRRDLLPGSEGRERVVGEAGFPGVPGGRIKKLKADLPTFAEWLGQGGWGEGDIRGEKVTWVSVAVVEEKARALAGLAKGAEVYVDGRLSLNAWTGKEPATRGFVGRGVGG